MDTSNGIQATGNELDKTTKSVEEAVTKAYQTAKLLPKKGAGYELYNVNPKFSAICKNFRQRLHKTIQSAIKSTGIDARAQMFGKLEQIDELDSCFTFLLDRAAIDKDKHAYIESGLESMVTPKSTAPQVESDSAVVLDVVRNPQLQATRYTRTTAKLDCRFDQKEFKVDDQRPSIEKRVLELFKNSEIQFDKPLRKPQPLLPFRRVYKRTTEKEHQKRVEKIEERVHDWASPYDSYLVAVSEREEQEKLADQSKTTNVKRTENPKTVEIKVEPEEMEFVSDQPYRKRRGRGNNAIQEIKRKRKS
ncbi:hypothetical protein M3Y94_01118300 [Aphelenchoides besseyi]|nr:hypothetical protein M3Y94_01118300 [Aphelenchoides besseyi]KAI6219230.1 hypothetical protein M3Y95_01117300 [Aphelenchoides besseyi]